MIERTHFRMVEVLGRADIDDHPVWADFHDGVDRRRVLGWGVDEADLDRELRKYDYCGRSPLYPVLGVDEAPIPADLVNPSIGLRFALADGRALAGYRVGESSFVVFADAIEVCLNPSLPSRWRREVGKLADALGVAPATLFPLPFREAARFGAAQPAAGRIEALDESAGGASRG